MPLGKRPEGEPRGITRMVYDCVELGLSGTQTAFATLAEQIPDSEIDNPKWTNVQAAINGVLGDRLVADGNRLAISMRRIPTAESSRKPANHLVLFIHGLCMSEAGWAGKAHEQLVSELQNSGHQVEYLRYNSGKHISENGAELSVLLDQAVNKEGVGRISLVGHSMGGLIIRSALGHSSSTSWSSKVHSAVYLGSPHHGAPLERIGNHANRLLKISPYTLPFMRLGNVRSAGIQDLRHGCISTVDWALRESADDVADHREPLPLAEGPRHTFIAATRSATIPTEPSQALDDYLVPVDSALGYCRHNRYTLHADRINRHTIAGSNHMHLLSGRAVHRLIHQAVTARA